MKIWLLAGMAGVGLALAACNQGTPERDKTDSSGIVLHNGDRDVIINHDTVEGNWKQLKGKAQKKWGKLTDNDLDVAKGDASYLSGKLQERYGIAREEADKWVKELQAEPDK